MTPNSHAPEVTKAALIRTPSGGSPAPQVFAFQFNPEQLTRHLDGSTGRDGRVSHGISFTLVLAASEMLENPDQHPPAERQGIYPSLAALESFLEPERKSFRSWWGRALAFLLRSRGESHSATTLFHWGTSRVMPVQLSRMTVTEQAFDPELNPIRAQVELELRVLGAPELVSSPDGRTALAQYCSRRDAAAARGFATGFRVDT